MYLPVPFTVKADNLKYLLQDLDGLKVKVARGFSPDMARVYLTRRHMKILINKDTSRYFMA